MSEKTEVEVLEPQYGFFLCTVEIATEDAETGKVKKVKEVHLVDAINVSDAHEKIAQEMAGTMWEWKVVSANASRIQMVY